MIHPVTITTPDGVERILRFTHGAELRVERHLKQPLSSLFLSEGKNNLEALSVIHKNASAIAYFCLPWDNGKPPQGIEEGTLGELYSPVEMGELVAALFECISQGAVKKKRRTPDPPDDAGASTTGDYWEQSWSFARTHLNIQGTPPASGKTSGEFWDLTANEFSLLIDGYKQVERDKNYRAGLVASCILNAQRTKQSQKLWDASDFFPDGRYDSINDEVKSAEEIYAQLMVLMPPIQ